MDKNKKQISPLIKMYFINSILFIINLLKLTNNNYYHRLTFTKKFNDVLFSTKSSLEKTNMDYYEISSDKGDFCIRKYPSTDLLVYKQVFEGDEYLQVVEKFKEYFKIEKPIIIDAGCNVGFTSLYFNSVFKEVILAVIEPSQGNLKMIEFNFKKNGLNAFIYRGGLWSSDTNLEILYDFRGGNHWSTRVKETKSETNVKGFSMKTILKECKFNYIDILKIDIEGAEKEVFTNNSDNTFLDVTKCIAIEIHDEFDCRQDIYDLLENKGFILSNHGELTIGINKNLIMK